MTNKQNGTLYIGTTRNLLGRVQQHKQKECEGFTNKYDLTRLVYYEEYPLAIEAITREKSMKKWKREWKIKRIETLNPNWNDLAWDWFN